MRTAIFVLSIIILTSCGKVPETHYYTLDHFTAQADSKKSLGSLIVQRFSVEPPYSQEKFIYRPNDFEIRFDHYRRWIQTPGELLSLRLVEYLRSTGAFEHVGFQKTGADVSPGRLYCTLLQFEESLDGADRFFHIRLHYQLSDADNRLLKSGYLKSGQPINGTTSEDIVRAANQAVSELFSELFKVLRE